MSTALGCLGVQRDILQSTFSETCVCLGVKVSTDSQTKGRREIAHKASLEGGAARHARLLKLRGRQGGGLGSQRESERCRDGVLYFSAPL